MKSLERLTKDIGYSFSKADLLKLALVHPSAGEKNNQRLEYLGDAVLELCISDLLYRSHPNAPEGKLTRLRAALVCEDTLVEIAQSLMLEQFIVSHPPLSREARGRSGILADAMEAVLAAVYLDGGFDAALQVISQHWAPALRRGETEINAKSELQELYQAQYQKDLHYRTTKEWGPAHARQFEAAVYEGETELARAEGKSKKLAEQAAADNALKQLREKMGHHEA